jgi:hypothetical protein
LEAGKPGALNLALSGDFDDQVLISVDSGETPRSNGKTIAIDRVVPGLGKISAHAKKGTKDVETTGWSTEDTARARPGPSTAQPLEGELSLSAPA